MRRDTGESVEPFKSQTSNQDGSFQALEQMANWVRFADTKATILTAALGVVMSLVLSHVEIIVESLKDSCLQTFFVGTLLFLTLGTFLYTLLWLVLAIAPRRDVTSNNLNRFAWPTLVRTNSRELLHYAQASQPQEDAWSQVIDLSRLAERKFSACNKAIWGFAGFILLAIVTIFTVIAISIV